MGWIIRSVGLTTDPRPRTATEAGRVLGLARLGGGAALLWGVANQFRPGGHGDHLAVLLLMCAAGTLWVGWLAARRIGAPAQLTWVLLATLGATGGVLASFAPFALGLAAVAALGAGIAFEAAPAVAVGVIGAVAVISGAISRGQSIELVVEGVLSVTAGVMVGASRRDYQHRTLVAERLLAEQVRADAERDRAAALAERNRLGREIHDVLAHSLGALAVQLDATDAVLETGKDPAKVRQLLQQARALAVQGLAETRQAVFALRDEPVELAEQLAALAAHDGAHLTVTGPVRPLSAEVGMALYRAAQEALTNARKHAPGASTTISLTFTAQGTTLVVDNGSAMNPPADIELARTGAGMGLQGMRERIAQLGGHTDAAPSATGWTVRVAIPS